MMAVIEKYAKDNGFSLILDVSNQNTPVLYASSGIDITSDIVSLYDKTTANGARQPRQPLRPALRNPPFLAPNRPPRRGSFSKMLYGACCVLPPFACYANQIDPNASGRYCASSVAS